MSRKPFSSPTGQFLMTALLPFLVIAVLGCVAVRHSDTHESTGQADQLTASDYAPEAFAPRRTPIWNMLLHTQYGAVVRTAEAVRTAVFARDRIRAMSEYCVCLAAYNQLAARVPVEAFAGQSLPRHLPKSSYRFLNSKPLG